MFIIPSGVCDKGSRVQSEHQTVACPSLKDAPGERSWVSRPSVLSLTLARPKTALVCIKSRCLAFHTLALSIDTAWFTGAAERSHIPI